MNYFALLKKVFIELTPGFADIFQDRCEILESSTRTVKRKPTQKCYWNIFTDWKVNLKETSPSLSEWKVLELKKNARNVGKKEEEEEELSQEDYFSDFRSVFDAESRHRRRSISELDEDELIIESPMKKIKQETPKSKKTLEGKSMAYKFGKAYQGMRRNLAVSMESGKKDNFDMWSSDEDIEALNQVMDHHRVCLKSGQVWFSDTRKLSGNQTVRFSYISHKLRLLYIKQN